MSSGTAPPEQKPVPPRPVAPPTEGERLIEDRLHQTRWQLASVEIAAGLIMLVVGTLVYLLAAVLADHWLPGGLGFGGRIMLFLVLMGGVAAYFGIKILPFLMYRIHPLFAAEKIEANRPGLKNSLVNLLFLRRQPQRSQSDVLSRWMYEGLEQRTADDLATLDVATTVDRSPAIRRGYALVVVLAILALYLLFSPKNPFVSIHRVLLPWADVPPPTRVTVEAIRPGDDVAFQGDTLSVSAEVRGLREGETAILYYTTADGQCVDQAVPMTAVPDGFRHECELPPGGAGLQQDVTYTLAAGDFRSRRFQIEVQTAPAILVDEIRYDYPDYIGLSDRTVSGTGDVNALEGTRITMLATANQPIRRAAMEMDCDARRKLTMTSEGVTATGRFIMAMRRDDPSTPQYTSYQIRFTDEAGYENRRPVRHHIDVIRDRPPEIHFVDPPADDIQLPIDGSLDFRVRAEDPDFALRRVAIRAERDGRGLSIRPLIEKPRPEKAHQGPFEGTYRFEPARLGLAVGDEVDYWAEAYDNKEDDETGPTPNRSETPRRHITIVEADPHGEPKQDDQEQTNTDEQQTKQQEDPSQQDPSQQDPSQQDPSQQDPSQQDPSQQDPSQQDPSQQDPSQQDPSQQDPSQQDPSEEKQSPEEPSQEPCENGEPCPNPEGQQADGGTGTQSDSGQPSREPIDGETNPGDAIEEVLRHRDENEKSKNQPSPETKGDPSEAKGDPSEAKGDPSEAKGDPSEAKGDPSEAKGDPSEAKGDPSEAKGDPSEAKGDPSEAKGDPSEAKGDPSEAKGDPSEAKGDPSEAKGDPSEAKGDPSEAKGDPSEAKGDPSEAKGDPSEAKGDPSEAKGDPSEAKGDPSEAKGDPSEAKGDPSEVKGDPSEAKGDPSEAKGDPSEAKGDPSEAKGDPSEAKGDPSEVKGDPSEAKGDPSEVKGDPSEAKGDPSEAKGDPSEVKGDPSEVKGDPSETKGDPSDRMNHPEIGAGTPDQQSQQPPNFSNAPPPEADAEDVNLDYARQQTELALEYLEDQLAREKPDQELLDRLGWDRDDLDTFVQRWRRMQEAAGRPEEESADKSRLDEALKSLGLSPRATQLHDNQLAPDNVRQLKDSRRFEPPAKWKEWSEAYTRSISAAQE